MVLTTFIEFWETILYSLEKKSNSGGHFPIGGVYTTLGRDDTIERVHHVLG